MSTPGLRNCGNGDCIVGSSARYKVYTGGADPLRQSHVLAHTRMHLQLLIFLRDTTMCSHHWARAAALRRPAGQHTQLRKGQTRGKQGKAGRRGTVVMECQDPKRAVVVDLDNDHDNGQGFEVCLASSTSPSRYNFSPGVPTTVIEQRL